MGEDRPHSAASSANISAESDNNYTYDLPGEVSAGIEALYVMMAVLSVNFLLNTLAAIGIVLQKRLRRKNTFFIIMLTCTSYAANSLGTLIYGCVILQDHLENHLILFMTQRKCFCLVLLCMIGKSMIIDFSFITAVDRCVAVFFPIWYGQRIKFCLVYIKMAIVATHIVIYYAIEYANTRTDVLMVCTMFTVTIMSRGMIALQIENDILIVLIILIYVVLLIWVEKELRKAKHDPDHLAITRTQMKVELLHTLAISISLFALTIAVANVLITVGIVDWENEDSIDYVRYSAIGYLGGIANFAVYYWRTKEIRKSFNYLVATMGRMAICKFDRKISVLPTTTSVAM